MKAPRSIFLEKMVLICCAGGDSHPRGFPLIRYIVYGHNEWLDDPTMADYNRLKKLLYRNAEDVIVFHGLCAKCKGAK